MSMVNIGRETNPEGFRAGHGTVGTSPAQLSPTGIPVLKHIVVRAAADNGGTISVGHTSAAAANGFVLAAGEQTPPLYVDDANKVWVVGSEADQDYSWVGN